MSDVPIADHAFLSDASTVALVTRDGSVDWLGLPRIDSPSCLGRLLDPAAGHLSLRPEAADATVTRRYLPESLVLESVWTTPDGRVVVLDALALGRDERGHDLGRGSPGVLLRYASAVDGVVPMTLEWAPRPAYGLVHPLLAAVPGGVLASGGPTQLLLSCDAPLRLVESTASGTVLLGPGEALAVALQQADGFDDPPPSWSARKIHRRIRGTERVWRSWSALHQSYDGPYADLVGSSGRVLQGLMHARTGAVAAAATTSLPEGIGSERTWDYRYTWVRDASMTMRGLWVAACPDEAARFFAFLATAAGTQLLRGQPLQVMFGVAAERDLAEHELSHLSGWRDSGPVRVGNAAWSQRQQDVYGALLDAALVLRDQLGPDLAAPTRELLVAAVETAAAVWRSPDQGLWEVRGPERRFTHSALMCWVALDRGIALADLLQASDRIAGWREVREEIRSAILTEAWDPGVGAFTQSFGSDALDAATLTIGLVGLLPPDDPRVLGTIDAVRAGLTDERGLVRRYQRDDLDSEEGSFLLCTFWLAEALARAGRPEDAADVLATAAAYANDLGLLGEQVDGRTGELLGNFPQAFSHLGLVLAAQALAEARAGAGQAAADLTDR